MDEDKKNVSCSFCQSKWLNEISLIVITGTLSANLSPLSASPDAKPATSPAASTEQFPIIKPIDAASAQSRDQYGLRKCCHILKNLSNHTPEKDARDIAHGFVNFTVKFTVRNADLVYGQALQAKMTEKPTAEQICLESLNIALEQIIPLAKNLGCFEELTKLLGKNYGLLFDLFRKEFQNATHLLKNRPDDGSGIRTDFAYEYAQKMEQRACAVMEGYSNLFTIENCPEEIVTLLNEYEKEIRETMANVEKNLGTSQSTATLNRINDELARFIVSKANAIAQQLPNEKIETIYRLIIITALPFVLPVVSEMGSLWAFANGLKNGGIPPLRKNFEIKFRLFGGFIIDQDVPTLNKEPEVDQSKLTATEKREADRRKQKENERREIAKQKYITNQIDIIIEWLYEITRGNLDVFQKRSTAPNWPI
ncbi:MAG: hypothetical protein LBD60_01030 [Puniceicoccales bacterium]|jgi:hypothetical protein|nr:hypothetical protein [Puniceicoccales bacterium]